VNARAESEIVAARFKHFSRKIDAGYGCIGARGNVHADFKNEIVPFDIFLQYEVSTSVRLKILCSDGPFLSELPA
jgi:hypothetical protein